MKNKVIKVIGISYKIIVLTEKVNNGIYYDINGYPIELTFSHSGYNLKNYSYTYRTDFELDRAMSYLYDRNPCVFDSDSTDLPGKNNQVFNISIDGRWSSAVNPNITIKEKITTEQQLKNIETKLDEIIKWMKYYGRKNS